jgi:hypothetical protein
MHNDLTLAVMEQATISLGKTLRAFSQKTCSVFATKELSREYNSRIRREGKKQASAVHSTTGTSSAGQAMPGSETIPQGLPPHGTNRTDARASAPFSDYAQHGRMHEGADGDGSSAHVTHSQPHSSVGTTSNAERGSRVDILPKSAGRRRKVLNLNTFKGHSAGDYVDIIREYGTCDSYSTEPVRYKYLKLSA